MLAGIGVNPSNLNGVIITHEHSDHVIGLRQLLKKSAIPVYLSTGTRESLGDLLSCGIIREFECGHEFAIGSLGVHPVPVLHDAADPCGFRIESAGAVLGVVTDLGFATTLVREHLKGCNALLLESNHDEIRLMKGTYPWYLKQRILSRNGHLSNMHSARLIQETAGPCLRHVVLMHLSQENNTPELAHESHAPFLAERGVRLSIAAQNTIGEFCNV